MSVKVWEVEGSHFGISLSDNAGAVTTEEFNSNGNVQYTIEEYEVWN